MVRLHATTVLVGPGALLIRGPSGSGKSTLAWSLMTRPPLRPHGGQTLVRLVADDQTIVRQEGGRLIASPSPPLEGLIEVRGQGIFRVAHEPQAVVTAVIELGSSLRLPDEYQDHVMIENVALPCVHVASRASDPTSLVLAVLGLSGTRLDLDCL